jgi:prevent-host-death family protein
MDETVTAAEANRAFSRLLRGVREGRSYLVTAHGRPLARLVPAQESNIKKRRVRKAALRALIDRAMSRPAVDIGQWTRDELYDR